MIGEGDDEEERYSERKQIVGKKEGKIKRFSIEMLRFLQWDRCFDLVSPFIDEKWFREPPLFINAGIELSRK